MLRLEPIGNADSQLVIGINQHGMFLEVFDRKEFNRPFDDDDRIPQVVLPVTDYPEELLNAGIGLIDEPVIGSTKSFIAPGGAWAGVVSAVKPLAGSFDQIWLLLRIVDLAAETADRQDVSITIHPMNWMGLVANMRDYWVVADTSGR